MNHRILYVILIVLLLINIVVLIMALTNDASTLLYRYRLIIGIALLTIAGFIRKLYSKINM